MNQDASLHFQMKSLIKIFLLLSVIGSFSFLSLQYYQWKEELHKLNESNRRKIMDTRYHIEQMNKANRILDELLIKKHQAE